MAKLLIDTASLWKLSWFKALSLELKMAYKYFYDTADFCGFCDAEEEVFQVRTGLSLTIKEIAESLPRHLVIFDHGNKIFIPQRFVDLYKGVKDTFNAKASAKETIERAGLSEYVYGNPLPLNVENNTSEVSRSLPKPSEVFRSVPDPSEASMEPPLNYIKLNYIEGGVGETIPPPEIPPNLDTPEDLAAFMASLGNQKSMHAGGSS